MGLLGDLAGAFIDGALEGIGMARDDLKKIGNKLNEFAEMYNNQYGTPHFLDIEILYGLSVSYLFFLSDDKEFGGVNPGNLEEDDYLHFLKIIVAVLFKLEVIDENDGERFTELIVYSLRLHMELMQKINDITIDVSDVYDRSEVGLKAFLNFAKEKFTLYELRKNLVNIFIFMSAVTLLDEKCSTPSSAVRFYIFAKEMNFSKLELLWIGNQVSEILGFSSDEDTLKKIMHDKYTLGHSLYDKNKGKYTDVSELYSVRACDSGFSYLEAEVEELKRDYAIKIFTFIVARKKEVLPEEIETITETITELFCSINNSLTKEEIDEKIQKEIELIEDTNSYTEYFSFVCDLDSKTREEFIIILFSLLCVLLSLAMERSQKAPPNYTYNFYLLKKYFQISDAEYKKCLKSPEIENSGIPEEVIKTVDTLLSDREIKYIKETFPNICEEDDDDDEYDDDDDCDDFNPANNIFNIKKRIEAVYDKLITSGELRNRIILPEHDENLVKAAVKSYAKSMQNENILLLFNGAFTKSFKSGFILTDKKIWIHNDFEDSYCFGNKEIGNLQLKKTLLSSYIKSSEIKTLKIDTSILLANQVELLLDLLKQSIAICLEAN